MMIRDMFADDINRKINGVIKVDQAADDVIEQELNEYVITRELKKHFITFFNYYGDAFDQPTADMGVWISGFFGSGKPIRPTKLRLVVEMQRSPAARIPMYPPRHGPQVGVLTTAPASMKILRSPSSIACR